MQNFDGPTNEGRGMKIPKHHRRDITALIRRARQYELRASFAKNPSERDGELWFATMLREKAARLALNETQVRPPDKDRD
jgi:hypothetical protein